MDFWGETPGKEPYDPALRDVCNVNSRGRSWFWQTETEPVRGKRDKGSCGKVKGVWLREEEEEKRKKGEGRGTHRGPEEQVISFANIWEVKD